MNDNDIQSIFIDINKAIEVCHKCEKFKNLPKNKPNFPIFFCAKSDENFNENDEKYLPCIIENVSQKCMANFVLKDIKFTELNLWALD